jgi:hypothetical protein
MMPDDSFEELRRVLDTRSRSDAMTAECLDDDIIAGLADGTLDPALRATVLPHLAACRRCRTTLASVTRALAEPAVARGISAAERGPRRLYRVALPLAAAAVVLLLLWAPGRENVGPGHRGDEPVVTTPVPVSPVGTVAAASVLVWTRVPGADGYRVTLFDAAGRVAYETRATDTAAALPDSLVLVAGRPYLWKVEARTGFDRWVTSELVEFSLAGHAP